jgi:type II secretion system protein J
MKGVTGRAARLTPLDERGFTLIEVVIAAGLSALLLVVLYSTYFGISKAVEAASRGQEIRETERLLIELLKKDLRGIPVDVRYPFVSQVKEMDNELSSTLEFASTSFLGRNSYGINKVGYMLTKTDDGVKVFVRQEVNDPRDDLTKNGATFELTRLITSFRLSFYDGTDWVEKWDTKAAAKLPRQVRITMTLDDGKGNTRTVVTDETFPGAL